MVDRANSPLLVLHPISDPEHRLAKLHQDARDAFTKMYAFGEEDPAIILAKIRVVGELTFGNETWQVVKVRSFDGELMSPGKIKALPQGFAIEGPAGIGKTTILQQHGFDGGDLCELRAGPFGLLAHQEGCGPYYSSILRQSKLPIVDRSDWMASLVYTAYSTHIMWLYDDSHLINFLSQGMGRTTLLVDDLTLSNKALHSRIINRGGFDAHTDLSYTAITRSLFHIAARHYHIPIITLDALAALCSSLPTKE